MNAQTKIQKILSETFSNVEVGVKLVDVSHGMLGKEDRGYPVSLTSNNGTETFYVRSVRHAQEIVEIEHGIRRDRERAQAHSVEMAPGLKRALGIK